MKLVLALLIGFLGANLRCRERDTIQEAWERADEAPRRKDMPGTYEGIKDGTVLLLDSNSQYSVMKEGNVLKAGRWGYMRTYKGGDHIVGPPGCANISFDWPSNGENWYSFVCYDGKTIVIDSIRSYTRKFPTLFSKETYGYRKTSE